MKFLLTSPELPIPRLDVGSGSLESRGALCCQTIPQLGAVALLRPTAPGHSSALRVASPVGQIRFLHVLGVPFPCGTSCGTSQGMKPCGQAPSI